MKKSMFEREMTMSKLFGKIIVGLTVLSLIIAPTAQAVTVKEIQDKGEIVMGTSPDFPPFEWTVMEDGKAKIIGIDAEIAQLIADELGVELRIDGTSFDALIPSLQGNKIDMALSGITETEERKKEVGFSNNYYKTESKFIIRLEDKDKYKSSEDFEKLKIGVQKGTIQEEELREHYPNADITSMNRNGDLIEALKNGKVEAILMDQIVVNEFVGLNKDKITIQDSVSLNSDDEGFAVAVNKDSEELIEVINKVIDEAVESGKISDMVIKYSDLSSSEASE